MTPNRNGITGAKCRKCTFGALRITADDKAAKLSALTPRFVPQAGGGRAGGLGRVDKQREH